MKKFLWEYSLVFMGLGFLINSMSKAVEAHNYIYWEIIIYGIVVLLLLAVVGYNFRKDFLKLLNIAKEKGRESAIIEGMQNLLEATMGNAFNEKTLPVGRYKIIRKMVDGLVFLCSSFDNKCLVILSLSAETSRKADFYNNSQSMDCFIFNKHGFTFMTEDMIHAAYVE